VVVARDNCGSLRPSEKTKIEKKPTPRFPITKKKTIDPVFAIVPTYHAHNSPRTIVKIEQMDSIQDEVDQPTTEKKKAGRPKGVFKLKRQIQEYARNPDLALPKTDNQRIKDLKDMLIRSSGKDVVEKMISIALNDNHPAQMAAIKMCVDRTLPVSMFEKDKSQRSAIHINITGIGAPTVATTTVEEEPKDIEDIEAKDG